LVEITAAEFATAALEAGLEITAGSSSSWWDWTAAYYGADDAIELRMTLFEVEPAPLWGGCELTGTTSPADLLALWHSLSRHLPGVYAHDDGSTMYTMDGFRSQFGIML